MNRNLEKPGQRIKPVPAFLNISDERRRCFLRGMWEGTPFPAFLLIKKVTKESDKPSKNKGAF